MIKLSILMPVYNEKPTVEEVISRVSKVKLNGIKKELIVIDDGSTDGTSQLLKKLRSRYHFLLINSKQNRGKGYSVRQGLKKITGQIVLIQDADLEYKVEEYPQLLKPIIDGKAVFVLGSRHLNSNKWKTRQFLDSRVYAKVLNFGAVLYSHLVNLTLNTNLTDPGTMYKIFKTECLDGIELHSNHFDIDWEIVAKFIRKGIYPLEIPVSYKSRSPKEGKKIRFVRDGILIFWAIIKYRFID